MISGEYKIIAKLPNSTIIQHNPSGRMLPYSTEQNDQKNKQI